MYDAILDVLTRLGASGVFLLMLVENVFPPIPSEVILPLAGYAAQSGKQSLPALIVAGTLGSTLGATFWYGIGRRIGTDRLKRFAARHGRWLTLTPKEVGNANRWFARYGRWAILAGRLIPGVRTIDSVPAGVTKMPLMPFLAYTFLGSAIWTALLALAGYELGERYTQVARIIEPASNVILGVIVLGYLWRVVTFDARR